MPSRTLNGTKKKRKKKTSPEQDLQRRRAVVQTPSQTWSHGTHSWGPRSQRIDTSQCVESIPRVAARLQVGKQSWCQAVLDSTCYVSRCLLTWRGDSCLIWVQCKPGGKRCEDRQTEVSVAQGTSRRGGDSSPPRVCGKKLMCLPIGYAYGTEWLVGDMACRNIVTADCPLHQILAAYNLNPKTTETIEADHHPPS